MKALTLTQPWATLVAIGAKRIETRSWRAYEGQSFRLAIHAAKGFGDLGGKRSYLDLCSEEPFKSILIGYMQSKCEPNLLTPLSPISDATYLLPFGAIVATCDLVAVKRIDELWPFPTGTAYYHNGQLWHLTDQERAFGNYTPGRYAWLLANVTPLAKPIPAKGAQGLWNWDEKGL